MSEKIEITKRAGVVSFFTLVSRVAGLVRDAVVAFFFGTTDAADAFYMAFTLPNLLRRFVAEGALTIAFIPVFSETLKKSREEALHLASLTFSYLSIILAGLTVAGIALAPFLVTVIAFGFKDQPEKFALTVTLTRLCFPYIFLVSLAALAMGILNALKRFASPAAAPILFNVGLIAGACFSPWFHPPVYGLALGVLLGGLGQLLLQWGELVRLDWRPRFAWGSHPALWRLLGLMVPAAYGAAVYQCNVIIVRLFASFLPAGSVSYLWYADRVFEFPVGVFAIAVATAIQPTLSDQVAEKDMTAFKESLDFGLRFNFLITIPAMAGLIVLAQPIVMVLFQRGAFSPLDSMETASTLIAFAVGLPFLGAVRILVPAFYALKDAKRPVVIATLAVAANLVFAFLLVRPLAHEGLALALSLAAAVNFIGLMRVLRKYVGGWAWRNTIRVVAQTMAASAVMAGLLWIPQHYGWVFREGGLWRHGLELAVLVSVGAGLYFLLSGAGHRSKLVRFFR